MEPFDSTAGLRVLAGNLGRAIIKVSAVKPERHVVGAPMRVFTNQEDVIAEFKSGALYRDVAVVVTQQGPRPNGMPEGHELTPPLGVLQERGFNVALVTEGQMSRASGKVPAAIQVTPGAGAEFLVSPGVTHAVGDVAAAMAARAAALAPRG